MPLVLRRQVLHDGVRFRDAQPGLVFDRRYETNGKLFHERRFSVCAGSWVDLDQLVRQLLHGAKPEDSARWLRRCVAENFQHLLLNDCARKCSIAV